MIKGMDFNMGVNMGALKYKIFEGNSSCVQKQIQISNSSSNLLLLAGICKIKMNGSSFVFKLMQPAGIYAVGSQFSPSFSGVYSL